MNSELPVGATHGTVRGTTSSTPRGELLGMRSADLPVPVRGEGLRAVAPAPELMAAPSWETQVANRAASTTVQPDWAHAAQDHDEPAAWAHAAARHAGSHHVDSLGSVSDDWTSGSETEPVEEPDSETEESEEELHWQDACVPELSSRLPRYTGRETPLNFATQ
tara:strand:+ start:739 stop:1230 length:492 start_codon:yes stop_codon:yes gene_type:complete